MMTDAARSDVTQQLMALAVDRTEHHADAATALLGAACRVLCNSFDVPQTIKLLRLIVDDAEAAYVAANGRREGESIQ